MKTPLNFLQRLIPVFCLLVFIPAIDAGETLQHPVIKAMPMAKLVDGLSEHLDYSTYAFRTDQESGMELLEKKGQHWKLVYVIKNDAGETDQRISRAEIIENLKTAAQERGGEILYQRRTGKMTFTLPLENNGTLWAHVAARTGGYEIFIIEDREFNKRLTFGAAEMQKALDEQGNVSVYGIYFDINEAHLRPGAGKAIIEIVKLMKANRDLIIEIQGHTDNTGALQHNLTLSRQRAETIKKFLLLYGIEESRLTAKGYGMKMPVDSNETEDGRAMNRRVELVKLS